VAHKLTFLKSNARGRSLESESVRAERVRIGQGGAGNGAALRVSWNDKKGGECVLLVDDEDTLRAILVQCEKLLGDIESSKFNGWAHGESQ
jgi:hypothetical protein